MEPDSSNYHLGDQSRDNLNFFKGLSEPEMHQLGKTNQIRADPNGVIELQSKKTGFGRIVSWITRSGEQNKVYNAVEKIFDDLFLSLFEGGALSSDRAAEFDKYTNSIDLPQILEKLSRLQLLGRYFPHEFLTNFQGPHDEEMLNLFGQCLVVMKMSLHSPSSAEHVALSPIRIMGGSSGSYFLPGIVSQEGGKIQTRKMLIFKPLDEEPGAPNNSKGHSAPFGTATMKRSIFSGESAKREWIAYGMSQLYKGFFGVPRTDYVHSMPHPVFAGNLNEGKVGSVQEFVSNAMELTELPEGEWHKIPIMSIISIAFLDMHLHNTD